VSTYTVLFRLILTPEGGSDAVTLIAVEYEGFNASHSVCLAEHDDRFLINTGEKGWLVAAI
jgi:hypothetical protein